MACDEKVIGTLGMEQRQDYSLALLNCSIKPYRIAAGTIACVVVAMCFLTNPKKRHGVETFGYKYFAIGVLYQDPSLSLNYEEMVAARYEFTSDYEMNINWNEESSQWVPVKGEVKEIELNAQNFEFF